MYIRQKMTEGRRLSLGEKEKCRKEKEYEGGCRGGGWQAGEV